MSFASDALLTKTDDELRFYVENPQYYQDELVEAARRELRRRGASVPAAATRSPRAPADYAAENFDEPARPRPALVPALVLLGVLALGAGGYWWGSATKAATRATAAASAAKLSPDSLKLETAEATPLPSFDVEQDLTRQLALVPAAEQRQAAGQPLRQYREVSRRFWRAERPTEYLIEEAASGKVPSYAILTQQISFLEGQWHQAGNALVYTYKFPPTMADQLARMRSAAATERQVLEGIKQGVIGNNPHLLSEKDAMKHAGDEALLEGLRHPAKPLEVHL